MKLIKSKDPKAIYRSDFFMALHAKINPKTHRPKYWPVLDDDQIKWVTVKKLETYDVTRCEICGKEFDNWVVDDCLPFEDIIKEDYGCDATLPFNLCYICGQNVFFHAY